MEIQSSFSILLIILSLGLIIPELFKKIKLPFITGIILAGAVLGPNAINIIEIDQTIEFFGLLGMIFLMLIAGLDTNLDHLKKMKHKIFIISGFNGIIPFTTGFLIATHFGYDVLTSFIVGIVFISSSVALLITMFKNSKLFNKKIGQITTSSILMLDAFSLLALTLVFHEKNQNTTLPSIIYLIVLFVTVFAIFYLLPKFTKIMFKHYLKSGSKENELRLAIVVIMGVLVIFSFLNVHAILSAFIAGVTLSHIIKSERLYSKIKTIGYSFFIPVFFFVIGMELDLNAFTKLNEGTFVISSLVLGLLIAKLLSGYFGGRFIGLKNKESALYGSASTVHLTTALAITYAAMSKNILDNVLVTSIIMITIISTIVGPILFKWINTHVTN